MSGWYDDGSAEEDAMQQRFLMRQIEEAQEKRRLESEQQRIMERQHELRCDAAEEMYLELHQAHHLHESLRDMVLNERGPLAEMNLGNDTINAILGLIDDHAPKIDSLAKADGK